MGTIHEHEVIKTKLEIQAQAQENTIHEIHDNIGQVLSLAKLYLATLDLTKPEEVAQKTFNSNQLLGKAIKDLRNLTKYLDAEHINRIGFVKSLEHELGFIPKGRTTDAVFTVTGIPVTVSKEEELVLFRIIQEAVAYFLNNSCTAIVTVSIRYQPSLMLVNIGATEKVASGKAFSHLHPAIQQIRNRSLIIGAQARMECTNDNKTAFQIALPLHNY